jgi:hypothetical protein
MKLRHGAFIVGFSLLLTSCGVADLAKQTADATACKALNSATSAQEELQRITDSISKKCVDVGVTRMGQ